MYTWEGQLFSSPFTFVHTHSHQCRYLSSVFFTAYKMTSLPSVLAGTSDPKTQTHTTEEFSSLYQI